MFLHASLFWYVDLFVGFAPFKDPGVGICMEMLFRDFKCNFQTVGEAGMTSVILFSALFVNALYCIACALFLPFTSVCCCCCYHQRFSNLKLSHSCDTCEYVLHSWERSRLKVSSIMSKCIPSNSFFKVHCQSELDRDWFLIVIWVLKIYYLDHASTIKRPAIYIPTLISHIRLDSSSTFLNDSKSSLYNLPPHIWQLYLWRKNYSSGVHAVALKPWKEIPGGTNPIKTLKQYTETSAFWQ